MIYASISSTLRTNDRWYFYQCDPMLLYMFFRQMMIYQTLIYIRKLYKIVHLASNMGKKITTKTSKKFLSRSSIKFSDGTTSTWLKKFSDSVNNLPVTAVSPCWTLDPALQVEEGGYGALVCRTFHISVPQVAAIMKVIH